MEFEQKNKNTEARTKTVIENEYEYVPNESEEQKANILLLPPVLKPSKIKNMILELEDNYDYLLNIYSYRCCFCPLAKDFLAKYDISYPDGSLNGRICLLFNTLHYKSLIPKKELCIQQKIKELQDQIPKMVQNSKKHIKKKAFLINLLLIFKYETIHQKINDNDIYVNGNKFLDGRCYECPILTGYRTHIIKRKKDEINQKKTCLNILLNNLKIHFKRKFISKETYEQRTQIYKNEIAKLEEEKQRLKTPKGKEQWLIKFQIRQDNEWLKRKALHEQKLIDQQNDTQNQ